MSKNLTLYEKDQRVGTLATIIKIALIASLALGLLNIQYRAWDSVIALFSLAIICLPLLWLNSRGRFALAAAILSVLILMAINVNLFEGDGIHDAGVLAYPIFIMIGILLFGKRATPYFSLAAMGSLVGIVALEIQGYLQPTVGPSTFGTLRPFLILLLGAAAVFWVVIGNMEKHLERIKEAELELRKNYDLTLAAWAKVLEYRDRETEGHSRRLVELSTRLARALGLGDEDVAHLQRGALMHDIGKLAIPDDILLKPGPLDEAERKLMQQHPIFAKQMLSRISFLQPCLDVAYSHHERWDGLGYPEGLQQEEIPLAARIFAIVDQWDALTSNRPYRKAWGRDAVIAYLSENAGKIYDPRIVDVFLTILPEEGTEAATEPGHTPGLANAQT
jgi:putative nucleotidyltransferase with HDIG domain